MTRAYTYRAFAPAVRMKPTGSLIGRSANGEFRDLGTYTQEIGTSEPDEKPVRMEFVIVPKRRRDPLLPFRRKEQDPATENRKQRRAREAKQRRSR